MMKEMKPIKREPHRCARCGGEQVSVVHCENVVEFRGLSLEVDGLSETVCGTCGYTWTTDGQEQDNLARLKSAYVHQRDIVRQKEGLLTGEEIRLLLEALNLSKSDASAIFGGGPNAFTKYINGDVLQSFAMDRLMRLTLGVGKRAVDYLRLGEDMPQRINSAGIFIAAEVDVSGSSVSGPLTVEMRAQAQIGLLGQESVSSPSRTVVS
jgi:putative zinc finger/helix-turn-helix YgiT family protein